MSLRRSVSALVAVGVLVAGLGVCVPDAAAKSSCPVARKLGRGVANLVLGFTEIPITMMDVSRYNGEVAGATWGLVEGIGRMVVRMGAGVAEIVTFPVAFPKPDYEPIVLPEFPGSRDAS